MVTGTQQDARSPVLVLPGNGDSLHCKLRSDMRFFDQLGLVLLPPGSPGLPEHVGVLHIQVPGEEHAGEHGWGGMVAEGGVLRDFVAQLLDYVLGHDHVLEVHDRHGLVFVACWGGVRAESGACRVVGHGRSGACMRLTT